MRDRSTSRHARTPRSCAGCARGCDPDRHHEGAGADDLALHGDRDLGQDPQPVEPRPGAGRLERRARARPSPRGSRRWRWARTVRARSGSRRRGAACSGSRSSAAGSPTCRSPSTGTGCPCRGRSRGACWTRPCSSTRLRALRRATRPRCHRPRSRSRTRRGNRPAPCASRCRRRSRRWRPRACRPSHAPRSRRPPTCCGPSATTCGSTTPTYGLAFGHALRRYLRGIHDDVARDAQPGAPGAAHARCGAHRRPDPGRQRRPRPGGGAQGGGPREFAVPGIRRADDARHRAPRARGRQVGGPRRGSDLERRGLALSLHRDVEPHRSAGGGGAGRPRPRRDADVGPADRAAERRGHAAVAGRADRGGAPLGASAPRSRAERPSQAA